MSDICSAQPSSVEPYHSALHDIQQARRHEHLGPVGIPIALDKVFDAFFVILCDAHLVLALQKPRVAFALAFARNNVLGSFGLVVKSLLPQLWIIHNLLRNNRVVLAQIEIDIDVDAFRVEPG